jgi:DNA-binding protein YbaB
MDTERWLAQYRTRIDGMKQAAVDLSENLAAATVTTSSADESVTVTIGPNGGLRDLRFSHRAAEHTHAELAALVLQTVAKGQRAVAEKVVEAFAPVGDTTTMDMLTSFVPEVETDEPAVPSNAYDELAADTPAAPQPPAAPPAMTPPTPTPARARTRPARPAGEDGDDFDERPW